MGGQESGREDGVGRGPRRDRHANAELIPQALRAYWWDAVATVARRVGDLAAAEDAVQEACLAALTQWPAQGVPSNPRAWLIGTARHKALDELRRETRRRSTEAAAMRELDEPSPAAGIDVEPADQLGLIFMCCHPALDLETRVALTMRSVCGLSTTEIAAAFLVSESAIAKRLVRARRKIRETGIPFAVPGAEALGERVTAVLRVVLLVFTEGHRASAGQRLLREQLCDNAIALARRLVVLLPSEPEVTGLLALLLLTDARRAARTDADGAVILLEDQDRTKYDQVMVAEGESLLERALRRGRPGPYQIQAAIAACHSAAPSASCTDWREVAALYGELIRHEPSPVHEANRAIAVAMAEGPSAGLVILDALAHHPQLVRWPALHVARADLLSRLGRDDDALAAYRTALDLDPAAAERAFVLRRMARLAPTAGGRRRA